MPSKRVAGLVVMGCIGALAAGFLSIFGVPFSYSQAIHSGDATIPVVAQFNAIFPASERYISYFAGSLGPTTWNSEAELYGRYVVTMRIPITLNALHNRIVTFGSPTFQTEEIQSVRPRAGGGVDVDEDGNSVQMEEWDRLVESGGDLAVLPMKIKKSAPVPLFNRRRG